MIFYEIFISKTVQKQLDKLPDDLVIRIINAVDKLKSNPRPAGTKKLKGRDGYRIRIGDYGIVYQILDSKLLINVISIGHRKDIYN